VGGVTSETAARRFQKRNGRYVTFRSEAAKNLKRPYPVCNGHSPTEKIAHSDVTVMYRPWPLAKAKGFILVWVSFDK
jgi:hypothetical protein